MILVKELFTEQFWRHVLLIIITCQSIVDMPLFDWISLGLSGLEVNFSNTGDEASSRSAQNYLSILTSSMSTFYAK